MDETKRSAAHPADTEYLPAREAYRGLVPVLMAFFMIMLDQTLVAVATPAIMEGLGVGYNAALWVTSAYLLGYAVPLLATGRLGDQFGQKRIFILGVAIYSCGAIGSALAPGIGALVATRIVQGLGASLISPQTLSIITRIFAPADRGKAMGWWGATAGLASLAGPVLGGIMTSVIGPQSVFWLSVPVGVACIWLATRFLPDLAATSRSFDIPGILVSSLAITGIVVGVQQGQSAGWAWWTWVLIIGGITLGFVFVRLQGGARGRGVEPLMPLRLFAHGNFSRGVATVCLMAAVTAANAVPIMLFLQQVQGRSAFAAGLVIAPMAIVSGVLSPWVGTLIGRVPPRVLTDIAFGCMAAGHLALWAVLRPEAGWSPVALASILIGLGHCFFWSPNSTVTMMAVPGELTGAGSGVYNAARMTGAVIGSALMAAVLQLGQAAGAGDAIFGQSLLAFIVLLAVGFIVGQGIRRPVGD